MNILVVEDDAASRKLIERFLAPYGTCTPAQDGAAALHLFTESLEQDARFDLICLDIMLPDMDGQIVLEQIRREEEARGVPEETRIPVFFTSGLDRPAYVEDEELRKRRIAYLVKPIERARLRELLTEFGLFGE